MLILQQLVRLRAHLFSLLPVIVALLLRIRSLNMLYISR
ncbi:chorismate lyase [Escherichia sp. MOD1-EC6475]|nr:chorismate lyase [Escherichia sp. MOD1-EC6475]